MNHQRLNGLIPAIAFAFVAIATTFQLDADTFIGSYEVNYRWNTAGCAPPGGDYANPNNGNPFHCVGSPGPHYITAVPGKYKIVTTGGSGTVGTAPPIPVWSGDAATGQRVVYTSGTISGAVEFEHTHGQIVLYFWDWYASDNSSSGYALIDLYRITGSDLVATTLQWDAYNEGIEFSYEVKGEELTIDTTAAMFWSTSSDWTGVPTAAIPAYSTTIERQPNIYGPFYLPTWVLGTPPVGATHLLMVVDPPNDTSPNGLIEENDETNNKLSIVAPLPELAVDNFQCILEGRQLGLCSACLLSDEGLPVNDTMQVTFMINNTGDADAGPFWLKLILMRDAPGEIPLSMPLWEQQLSGLAKETTWPMSRTVHLADAPWNDNWYGKVTLAIIIDPATGGNPCGEVIERDEETENNHKERTFVLYDPLYDYPGDRIGPFASKNVAQRYLMEQDFSIIDPSQWWEELGANQEEWSKNLPAGPTIRSWYNGLHMPAELFRIQARILDRPAPNVGCEIAIQGRFQFVSQHPIPPVLPPFLGAHDPRGYLVPTGGEPDPYMAWLNIVSDWGWFNYVKCYHFCF